MAVLYSSRTGSLEDSISTPLPWSTLQEMVQAQAASQGKSSAILAPGRDPLCFARLEEQIQRTRVRLWERGIGRGDVIVNVVASGSDAAAASLCVTTCATVAVINPDLLQVEYASLFKELAPKLVLAYPGQAEAARRAAQVAGVPVADVVAEPEAGAFTLRVEAPARNDRTTCQPAQSGDIAYILTTSGSTARPKLVPLSHRVLCSSVANAAQVFTLTTDDRCLNFSPQFHSLGFNGGFLIPLGSGGSAVCTPGFQADDFFQWLDEFHPTWFFAVPAILHEILGHSSRYREALRHSTIRFLCTSGAPLPRPVAEEIEALFEAPLLQVYGLSEAQNIAMDHLPGERRRGSCGRPCCNEVMIVDSDGRRVPPGAPGEVVVRGPAVTDGYFRDSELTRTAFRDGWFHTGDIGYFDADKYLFLTGRASEFINRGGEKISPVEVDQVLVTHPAVLEAITFSIPHDKLGEDIAAAVVARDGASITEAQLQEFAAGRLAAHKLPRRIFFLERLPLGPTGKIQRCKMWEYISGPASAPNPICQHVEPRDARERRIAELFARVLRLDRVGVHDSFFDLGGDSLAATLCALLLEKEFGDSPISSGVFLWAPTVAQLAEILADPARLEHDSGVLPFRSQGDGVPLFLIHPGHEGARIARHLGENHPLFGIPIPASDQKTPRSMDELASECTRVLQHFRPNGRLALAGWCAAGVVALEVARRLEQQGREVCFVALLDAQNFFLPPLSAAHLAWVRWWQRLRRFTYATRRYPRVSWARFQNAVTGGVPVEIPETTQALLAHRPQPWAGRMVHIWASDCPHGRYFDPGFGWNHLAPNGIVFHQVHGDHLTLIQEPSVRDVARILASELDRAQNHS